MMKQQLSKNIGVKFCGGCNCYYDREKVYDQLRQHSSDRYRITLFEEELDTRGSYDLIVVINGCSSECLVTDQYRAPLLVINNLNQEEAADLMDKAID